ncbi:MAG: cation-translocating P-type ATPase [Proteobacteria bacterium]|nr:cation-translocating P-type ATPase [Pseudomonadota bacterium]
MPATLAFDPAGRAGGGQPRALAAGGDEHHLLDDPQQWPAFGRALKPASGHESATASLWESQFLIEGMHCAACSFTVEAALSALPGVEQVYVDATRQRLRLRWRPDHTRPSLWLDALRRAGYGLVPATVSQQAALQRRESRLALWRWLVAGLCMMQVMMYAYPAYTAQPGDLAADSAQLLRWASWVLCLPVLLFSSGPFFRGALRDLRAGSIGMDLPVALGIAITFAVSSVATFEPAGPLGQEVFFDSLSMFVFFLLSGRLLEARLRERTAGALDTLLHRMPETARRLLPDGKGFERVPVGRLAVGDIVQVLPGERFVADGLLLEGATTVSEALLSGESRPLPRLPGERVLAGAHNLSSAVRMKIQALGEDTRFAGIVALMENASLDKPRLLRLADRVARPFLVVVLAAAAASAVLWWPAGHGQALMVAVSVLIVTCPCALSLAVPAAMLSSAGSLARGGLLVREVQALETLAGIDTVVFDKTGTLTRDPPRLARIYCREGLRPREALARAAAIAAASLHPAARGLAAAWCDAAQPEENNRWHLLQSTELGGQGVQASLRDGCKGQGVQHMRLGSAAWCDAAPLDVSAVQVHLSDEWGWAASFVLTEDLRPDAASTVQALKKHGLQVHLLSGDRSDAVRELAGRVGIDKVQGGCAPEDKLRYLQALQAEGRRVLMVGDGLNDGPVLARADVSFAFGPQAAPLAQARADFIALGGELGVVEQAWVRSRATLRVVRQNLAWAAGYNALCIPIALAGWMPAWLAGLGMALSSLAVVANAARLSARSAAA